MSIETKRTTLELKKVEAAKEEMELKIMVCEQEIENLRVYIDAQDKRILELKQKLADNK